MAFEHDYNKYPELTNTQMQQMQFSSPHKQITESFYAEVVKVHDGDTITVRAEFRDFDFPVRLLDIDAPELNEGGEEAREWLKQRILNQTVQIIINRWRRVGKYGRLLGKVFYLGLDVGQEEIYLGLAKPFGKKQEGKVPSLEKVFSIKKWF